MAKHRMSRGLVALSASAIAAVYAAGYLHTQAADASIASAEAAPTAVVAAPRPQADPQPRVFVQRPGSTDGSGAEQRSGRQRDLNFRNPDGAGAQSPGSLAAPAPAPTLPPASSAPAQAATSYKDGTYSGAGNSRRGGVQVSVTVAGGRISKVDITRITTQYPVRYIAALPGQVISRQSANVDLVSGATYSAMAFRSAVQQALSQAL